MPTAMTPDRSTDRISCFLEEPAKNVVGNSTLSPEGAHRARSLRKDRPATAVLVREFEPGIGPRLFFIQIFAGNIVFRHLVRANFLFFGVPSALHASDNVGLERVPFLD